MTDSSQSWIPVIQVCLTGLLGVGAAAIAFLQWRTAHHKVVMDLFDKRISVIERMNDIILRHLADQDVKEVEYHHIKFSAGMLFDDATKELIRAAVDNLRSFHLHKDKKRLLSETEIANKALLPYLRRYIRMDQKLIRTPFQWFDDANARRKSYSDQPAGRPPEGGRAAQ